MPGIVAAAGVLVLLAAWLTMYGMLTAHSYTLKPVLDGLADLLDRVRIPTGFGTRHPLGAVSKGLRHLERSIRAYLASGLRATEHALAWLWNDLAHLVRWTARTVADLAVTLEHRLHVLEVLFPALILRHLIDRLRRELHHLERTVGTAARATRAKVGTIAHATTVALPHAIGRLGRRTLDLERWRGLTRKRLLRMERALAGAGAAALVGTALARLGLKCLLNRNGKTLGKKLCRVDPDYFEDLLGLGVAIAGTVSLVTFAREVQEITDEVSRGIHFLIRET